MNIYLAGKIEKECWRHGIVSDLRESFNPSQNGEWTILVNHIGGEHNYTGPFFISCDHGCYHRQSSHGCGATDDRESFVCNGEYYEQFQSRKNVVSLCLKAIERSDLIFAWIDTNDCYGTMFELSYALAKKKTIVLSTPHGFSKGNEDMWFLFSAIDIENTIICADSPIKAFEKVINLIDLKEIQAI